MKKVAAAICLALFVSLLTIPLTADAQETTTYTVQPGDSMWKIAVRYQVGLTEIIEANPHIQNPSLIYPGQRLTIPLFDEIKRIEHRVIQLTNQERAKHGLPALTPNWELSRVARFKSADMRDRRYFSHQSPTYGSPFDMIRNFGISYRSAAENIAMGQTTPEQVVQSWMNSEGHRRNILSRDTTVIGVGYAQGGTGRHYWTQMFIRP